MPLPGDGVPGQDRTGAEPLTCGRYKAQVRDLVLVADELPAEAEHAHAALDLQADRQAGIPLQWIAHAQ